MTKQKRRTPRRRLLLRILLSLGLLALLCGTAVGVTAFRFRRDLASTDQPPEAATGRRTLHEKTFEGSVVVAAHPDATAAGQAVLAAGGSAVDAAVAVQLALGLVEPQSSGVGGGAFLLYWDATADRLHAYDGRERAPLSATASFLLNADGKRMRFDRAMLGGRSVGVPGVMRMLEQAHAAHGRLPWAELFEGPIALAEEGFKITPRLNRLVSLDPALPTQKRQPQRMV